MPSARNLGHARRPGRRTHGPLALALASALLLAEALGAAPMLPAQSIDRAPRSALISALRFDVTLGAEEALLQQLKVRARFKVEGRTPVLLSMAAWTPGAYEIANFARHVTQFSAKQNGKELTWDKADPDTWRIVPTTRGEVELTYLVRADTLDNARAWTREDFGFFNGTTTFLFVEGQSNTPATVQLHTERDWLVATGMTPGDSAHRYTARDVHDLLDHPFFVGRFALDSTLVADRWMRLATYPATSLSEQQRTKLWDALRRSVEPLAKVFGEVPWKSYTVLQVADSGFGGMSALEHTESELAIVGAEYVEEPFVVAVHVHEIVHAWNVKRLRPADLVPYRYDAMQPTTWLWMSEGITDYYADLAQVRSLLIDEAGFLATTLGKIDHTNAVPVIALEDASLQSWLSMSDGTSDIYYDKGSLAGLALDIIIRDASDNARSLDDVMREIWNGPYKAGRGFTSDEFWNAATRAAGGKALGGFAQRYIDGRETMPWDKWLPLAGWRIVSDSVSEPRLGALLRGDSLGVRVEQLDPQGAGVRAGLEIGDIITAIGGRSTLDPTFGERWREFWGKRPGAVMTLDVRRNTNTLQLDAIVEVTTLIDTHIAPDPEASEKARRVRAGILRGR
ncbi:MAG: M61 family metallopeptidase [Gemmatimonadaceae bacterium]|nr:M61 family metallopeptidase [Gemmatimonadaceae bacterium]